jgi:hypothetical protein
VPILWLEHYESPLGEQREHSRVFLTVKDNDTTFTTMLFTPIFVSAGEFLFIAA